MLKLRIGQNLQKRIQIDKNMPQSYISIKSDNISDSLNYIDPDFFNENKSIRIYDFDQENVRDFFYKYINNFAKSNNIFFIDELSLNKATEDKLIREIIKNGGDVYDIRLTKDELKQIKDEEDNPFFFIDYYLSKNKEKAWKELMRIKDKGFAEHEILGAFMWKASFIKNKKLFEDLIFIIGQSREEKSQVNIYNELEKMVLRMG